MNHLTTPQNCYGAANQHIGHYNCFLIISAVSSLTFVLKKTWLSWFTLTNTTEKRFFGFMFSEQQLHSTAALSGCMSLCGELFVDWGILAEYYTSIFTVKLHVVHHSHSSRNALWERKCHFQSLQTIILTTLNLLYLHLTIAFSEETLFVLYSVEVTSGRTSMTSTTWVAGQWRADTVCSWTW